MRADLTYEETLLFNSGAAQRREMMQRVELERVQLRREKLDSQSSPEALPAERIRIWEGVHALQLPRAEGHPLIAIIAQQTHLSVTDIRDEQSRRRLEREAAVGGP